MKKISSVLALAVILGLASLAYADISLSVNATATSGTCLGDHVMLKCKGYNYNKNGDPWTQCQNLGAATSMAFGDLVHMLKDTAGNETDDAGCFYGESFFIIYLYPDAWGGKGYDLKQSTASFSTAIKDSVVRAPVYAKDDGYTAGNPQGDLTTEEKGWNPNIVQGKTFLANDVSEGNNRILKCKRARIVRAEYGIPPIPGTGDVRPTGWKEIPKTTLAGTYTGSVKITLYEWQ